MSDNDLKEVDLKKERKRIAQKIARNTDGSKERERMKNWNKSEKYKKCRQRYFDNGGINVLHDYLQKVSFPKRKKINRELIAVAEKHKKKWTAADEVKLLELYKIGITYFEMAKLLSRSKKSIERKLHKLNKIHD